MTTLTETTTQTKEQKGRTHIAKFLSAMKFHDHDLQATIKLMRNKLLEIRRKESSSAGAVMIKKSPKVIIKFNGSKIVLCKRPLSETLAVSGNNEAHTSKTLVIKRQKIMNNNCDHDNKDGCKSIRFTSSRIETQENPRGKNNEGVNDVIDFIKSVGGSGAELVFEKRLTVSDVNTNQGRLLIPVLQVKNKGFLTADEEVKAGKKEDVSVWVFDPERRKLMLNLVKWKMSKDYYVLKTNWNQVVKMNGLKEEMVIRVLSFRVDQQLCFALDRVA